MTATNQNSTQHLLFCQAHSHALIDVKTSNCTQIEISREIHSRIKELTIKHAWWIYKKHVKIFTESHMNEEKLHGIYIIYSPDSPFSSVRVNDLVKLVDWQVSKPRHPNGTSVGSGSVSRRARSGWGVPGAPGSTPWWTNSRASALVAFVRHLGECLACPEKPQSHCFSWHFSTPS